MLHEDKIYFASAGKTKAFLIYDEPRDAKNKNDPEKADYQIVDITKQAKTSDQSISPSSGAPEDSTGLKLFANVISGSIPESGSFIFTNEALPEYISQKKLTEVISTLPPLSAVEQIKNTLSGVNAYVSFLCVIIKNTTSDHRTKVKSGLPTNIYDDSIVTLNKTEDRTENLLSPSGIVRPKKWLSVLSRIKFLAPKPPSAESKLALKDKIFSKRKAWSSLGKGGVWLKNAGIYTVNILFFVFKIATDKQKMKNLTQEIYSNIKKFFKTSYQKIISLNLLSKILLIIFVVFISLFFVNLFFKKTESVKQTKTNDYINLKNAIEQKENQAEANLLYSNEEGARKLFEELTTLFDEYPQENEAQINELNEFRKNFNLQMEKIRRVTRVEAGELANFTNLIKEAASENITLASTQNKIFTGDSTQNAFYILDTTNNLATTLANLNNAITRLAFPVLIDKNIYYFNNTNFIQLNAETEERNVINISVPNAQITAADTYNSRIYLLNAQESQIYRYQKSGAGFNAPTSWVADNVDLANAVDLSIDGHIYVLINNGQVVKLLRGEAQEFKLEEIDPLLEHPSKLFVSPEQKFIYILEPRNSRLVIFDKTGQFILQYKFDNLPNLKDFAVDEQNKKIYILNDNSVWSFVPTHFEE